MNILLVDDSRTVRRVLKSTILQYFEGKKYGKPSLYDAGDGVEALECIKAQEIDIIFLDYNMPNMNGEELVDAIRSEKKWNRTRIIMVTTEGSKESVMRLMKKGVNQYIVKPFVKESINKKLDMTIHRMITCVS